MFYLIECKIRRQNTTYKIKELTWEKVTKFLSCIQNTDGNHALLLLPCCLLPVAGFRKV